MNKKSGVYGSYIASIPVRVRDCEAHMPPAALQTLIPAPRLHARKVVERLFKRRAHACDELCLRFAAGACRAASRVHPGLVARVSVHLGVRLALKCPKAHLGQAGHVRRN